MSAIDELNRLAKKAHRISKEHGFYDEEAGPWNFGEKISLMHSELSEALEAHRNGKANEPSEHCPEITTLEEEFADEIIRVLDTCEYMGLNIGKAIITKMSYNDSRPYKHGKKY